MSDELSAATMGVSIDPSTWKEPKEMYPGVVVASAYKLADDKYKAATSFRPALEGDIPQWDLRIKRLDAELLLPDGSKADAIRYGGIDLKRWSNAEKRIVPISARFQKEFFIMSAWKKIAGTLEPPEVLVGKKFLFDFFAIKSFGSSMPAKNVLVPVQTLAPDYEYTGDIRVFEVRERESNGSEEATSSPTPSLLTEEDAEEMLVTKVLPGLKKGDPGSIVGALPDEIKLQSIITGVANGSLIERLLEEGKITVNSDGVFV